MEIQVTDDAHVEDAEREPNRAEKRAFIRTLPRPIRRSMFGRWNRHRYLLRGYRDRSVQAA